MKIVLKKDYKKGKPINYNMLEPRCECGGLMDVVHSFGIKPYYKCKKCGKEYHIKYKTYI